MEFILGQISSIIWLAIGFAVLLFGDTVISKLKKKRRYVDYGSGEKRSPIIESIAPGSSQLGAVSRPTTEDLELINNDTKREEAEAWGEAVKKMLPK